MPQPDPVTQRERLNILFQEKGVSVRLASRELSERYGKTPDTWKRQLSLWRSETKPHPISDELAAQLETYFGAPAGYLTLEKAQEAERHLAVIVLEKIDELESRLEVLEGRS